MKQRERTSAVLTEVLRNRNEVVISCISEMTVMMTSRAREESAEKKSATVELITERSESLNEDSIMSESSKSVRAELIE